MYPQHKVNVTQPQAATAPERATPEFYLPSGGTDPDFYFPADRGHEFGRFSRWIHGLPVVGRLLG
jgi:hypothetical protein